MGRIGTQETLKTHFYKDKAYFIEGVAHRVEDFFTARRRLITFIHWGMFILFLLLIIIPPFLPEPPEDATPFNNFTLFADFIFWGLWFPLVLLSTVFLGRAWCGLMCPQGALSEYVSRIGLNKEPPSWIRWEGTPIISFVFVTILGQVVGVRDYPLPMLEIFGGTMVLALVIGFIYTKRHRTWCRYLCPIGLLLGIFSRLGIVNFEGRIARKKGLNGQNSLCPTFIDLTKKSTSRHCIECFKCTNWKSSNALHLRFRVPGSEIENIDRSAPHPYEVFFLFGATGLALGAFHWQVNPFYIRYKWALGSLLLDLGLGGFIGKSGPWWIMSNYPHLGEVFNYLDLISITSFMVLSMILFAGMLFILTFLSAHLAARRRGKLNRMELLTRLGYSYAPVTLVSLVLGLGGELFQLLRDFLLGERGVEYIKVVFFSAGVLWSLYLALKILRNYGEERKTTFASNILNLAGIGLITLAWYPVLF